MITSGFLSAQDRKELLGCIKRHTEEHGVARRANALLLLDDGLPFAQVAKVLYLHNDTVRGWYKQYQTGGWDLVASNDWQGGQSRMTVAQEAVLIAWLEGRVCRSVAEIRAYILAEFGIHYAHSGCVKLMARLGFEYRKPRAVPRVADPEDQAAFIAFYTGLIKYLQPDEAIYFADAVHPEHQSKPASEAFPEKVDRLFRLINAKKSSGWFKKGSNPAVNTTSGRGRVIIHAALNLENFDTPLVAPDTVNGVSAAQLLAKIEARNKDKRKIYIIWDNAAYHKSEEVRAFLSRPKNRIHLIKLPPYCPHLNPIERLWKVMHGYVTHNRYYPTEKQFMDAILGFFREAIPKNWKNFRDQVTDNFRVISHQNLRVLE